MPSRERKPDPAPVEANEKAIVLAGIALWALALVVLTLFFRDDLRRHDATWWLWTCGLGIVMGLYGYRFVSRRRRD